MSYVPICKELGTLLDEKNNAYGDSWTRSAKMLKVVWPDGIPTDAYQFAAVLVRMFDKVQRIVTSLGEHGHDPMDEDALGDLAGYAVLAWAAERDE